MNDHAVLYQTAGYADLSARSRLCLLGADRAKFLHGQVTNEIHNLRPGDGCYAALVTAKGKIQSDLHVYILENEILLEFEPGLNSLVKERLEKYIIAEDAQVVDVAPLYGLWTVQGPKAAELLQELPWKFELPAKPNAITKIERSILGEAYVARRDRTLPGGYDLFVPIEAMPLMAEQLKEAAAKVDGTAASDSSLEIARIEAGLPRYGTDMDDSNLAPEILGADALSYAKGCYIGQEIIARVRTYGQVAKSWHGFRLADEATALPGKGDRIFLNDKEVGHITSAVASPHFGANLALGYLRREASGAADGLTVQTASGKVSAKIVALPFDLAPNKVNENYGSQA